MPPTGGRSRNPGICHVRAVARSAAVENQPALRGYVGWRRCFWWVVWGAAPTGGGVNGRSRCLSSRLPGRRGHPEWRIPANAVSRPSQQHCRPCAPRRRSLRPPPSRCPSHPPPSPTSPTDPPRRPAQISPEPIALPFRFPPTLSARPRQRRPRHLHPNLSTPIHPGLTTG